MHEAMPGRRRASSGAVVLDRMQRAHGSRRRLILTAGWLLLVIGGVLAICGYLLEDGLGLWLTMTGASASAVSIFPFLAGIERRERIAGLDALAEAWAETNPTTAGAGRRLDLLGVVQRLYRSNRGI